MCDSFLFWWCNPGIYRYIKEAMENIAADWWIGSFYFARLVLIKTENGSLKNGKTCNSGSLKNGKHCYIQYIYKIKRHFSRRRQITFFSLFRTYFSNLSMPERCLSRKAGIVRCCPIFSIQPHFPAHEINRWKALFLRHVADRVHHLFRQPVPPVFFGNKQKPIKGPQPYSLGISSRLVNVQKAAASSSRKATRALSLFSKSFGSIFSAPKMLLLSMGSLLQKRWSHPTVHGRVPLR